MFFVSPDTCILVLLISDGIDPVILYDLHPGSTRIQADLLFISVVIMRDPPWRILLPADINGFASGNKLALSAGNGINIQIAVSIVGRAG